MMRVRGEAEACPAPPVDGRQALQLRLAANSLVQVAGTVATAAIGIATFAVVTRALGPSTYGYITAAAAFLYIPIILADIGLSPTVVRQISARADEAERIWGTSLPLRAAIAVLTSGAGAVVALALPLPEQTKLAIEVGSIGAVFTILYLSVVPVLEAQLRMQYAVVATVAGRAMGLGLTAAVLAAGFGFFGVVCAAVGGLGLTFLFALAAAARHVRVRLRVDPSAWAGLLRASSILGAALGILAFYGHLDTMLLALLKPSREVGLYGAAYKFVDFTVVIGAAAGTSLFPVFSRLFDRDAVRMRALMQKALDVLLACSLPLAIFTFALAPDLVDLAAGRDFGDAATTLRVLAPSLVAIVLQVPFVRLLMASGRHRELLVVGSGMFLANLALNLAFIPPYGTVGAAAASDITGFAGLLGLAVIAAARLDFQPHLRYVPTIAVATAALLALLLVLPGPHLLAAALASCAYLGVLLLRGGPIHDLVVGAAVAVQSRPSR